MKVAIIDHVGGHVNFDNYIQGLVLGIKSKVNSIYYFTCIESKNISGNNIFQFDTFGNIWKTRKFKYFLFAWGFFYSIYLARKFKCKIVHLHFFGLGFANFLLCILTKLIGLKLVVTVHDVESFARRNHFMWGKLIYKLTDAIILHNETSKFEVELKINNTKKLHTIQHGNFLHIISNIKNHHKNEEITLLFFGQIKYVKGLDILLQAMKNVTTNKKNFRLIIAGRPYKLSEDEILQEIKNYGLEHLIECNLKFIPESEVSVYFERASLVVLPYRKIYQSGVLLLAMSYGRAVLTSDLPAFKEIISDNENGLIFRSGDVDSLTQVLLNINQDNLNQIVKKADSYIRIHHNWNKLGDDLLKVYDEVLVH
jgi:D-inositol-3-phosphate glycosyltransferase